MRGSASGSGELGMSKREDYRRQLRRLEDWDAFLLQSSGLPGPRGNLELAEAVADEGDPVIFSRFRTYTPEAAPTNSPYEFLAFCGVLGLGRLLAEGQTRLLDTLRPFASDPRWRIREAVAMALQRLGDVDMPRLLKEMARWSRGTPFEQRAAAAGLCEPRLLRQAKHTERVLDILDRITGSISGVDDRKSEAFIALRKGLAYCWSVAVVALPEQGVARMEKWFDSPNKDVRWIMKQNLKKARLARLDPAWVERSLKRLGG
jgi:HEAT repeat protein